MGGLFICGTDTGVGKTMVTGLLAKYLLEKGINAITQKWIQTGIEDIGLIDNDYHYQLPVPGKVKTKTKTSARAKEKTLDSNITKYKSYINPYRFAFPSSPHLSAKLEGKKISVRKIIESFKTLEKSFDFVVVEGTGGLLVPIDEKILIVDIVKKLVLPVIIISENKLGTINHTLLTIEALRKRNMKVLGVIFNSASKNKNKIILEDNPKIVKKISECEILGVLPYRKNVGDLYKIFKSIGHKISQKCCEDEL